jgi:hypothetical protein
MCRPHPVRRVEGEEANRPMKVLLSRWQFGITITYHFLFVPLTIGLALLVAVMQVLAYVKKDEGCRTRPGGCRSAGRHWTGWPISAGCPCRSPRPARTPAPPEPGERTGRLSSRCAGRRPAIRTGEAGWCSAGSTWNSSRGGRSRWPGRTARARRWPSTPCFASPTSPPGR